VLLVIALLIPWNVYFGSGVPDSDSGVYTLLLVVTALSLVALAVTYVGQRGVFGARFDERRTATMRLGLNSPYLLMVAGFVAFALAQTVRYGGSGNVPPGVGPGVWLGLAGSLLAAQPTLFGGVIDDVRFDGWYRCVRIIGFLSIVGATLSVSFNLYWRTRYVLPGISDATHGAQNTAVVVTTVAYGAVALMVLVVASRWLLRNDPPARLATIVLGASTLSAGLIVWLTEIGRDIDAFHGISQTTSTAAVGFEGYLAWVAAAAIVAPPTLLSLLTDGSAAKDSWRAAARKCLLLIAIWCVGAAILRAVDVVTTLTLSLPLSLYDSVALLAFDVVAAAVAVWLRINLTTAPVPVISVVSGVLSVLAICRVAVGVGLAPRIEYVDSSATQNAVYGNALAHQITSTFDAVVCGLALAVLAVVLVTGQLRGLRLKPRAASAVSVAAETPAAAHQASGDIEPDDAPTGLVASPVASVAPRIYRDGGTFTAAEENLTQSLSSATAVMAAGDATQHLDTGLPRIFRPDQDGAGQIKIAAPHPDTDSKLQPSVARVLKESSQRFGAGTTYTGSGRHRTPEKDN
jgi:hypothetical protein